MSTILFFISVFILFSSDISAKKLKILVNAPNAWFSHALFQGKLADVLVEAGHEVHFLIPEWNPGCHVNFSHKAHQTIRFSAKTPTQIGELDFIKNSFDLNIPLSSTLMGKIRNVSDQFCIEMTQNDSWLLKMLNAENYDVGISEALDPCMFGIFEKSGISTKLISSSLNIWEGIAELFGIPIPSSYVPVLVASPLSMNYLDRVYNLYQSYTQEKIPHSIMKNLDPILKASFGQNFPDLIDIFRKTSLVFINFPEFLDIPRPTSSKLVHIGGITMSTPNPLTMEMTKIFKKSKKGVVVVSFGTVANTELLPEHILQTYLEAFSNFPDYEFIWKYDLRKNDLPLFEKFPNVHPVKWLEQNSLLAQPKTKAFMSHVGLNSLIESSFHGVPLIATPLFVDQNYNTYVSLQQGTGVYINFKEISIQIINETLREVLYSEKYYNNAQKLKKRLESYPYKIDEKFVKYVEYAAENSFNDDINLVGANMSFFEYYCLDIIIPFVIIPLTLFTIFVLYTLHRLFVLSLFYYAKINKID